ncbi:hypothetical protein [Vibrio crassostreae]|uniref:hypothetical protein n=1 Tax=Vibrio crassostreae TaxID=246167 RepID=UPI001B314945|nr:hypothetical protein [Vibrio crassostreae]
MPHLYPNKLTPTSWRVTDKKLGVQEYFPFKMCGSKEAALLEAIIFEENLAKRKLAEYGNPNLGYNMVFNQEGEVKGLRYCNRKEPMLAIQFTVDGKQMKNSRLLKSRSIKDAFYDICEWSFDKRGIDSTQRIRSQLKRSLSLFVDKYSLIEE